MQIKLIAKYHKILLQFVSACWKLVLIKKLIKLVLINKLIKNNEVH